MYSGLTDGRDDDGSSRDAICNDVDETVIAATHMPRLWQSRSAQKKRKAKDIKKKKE